MKRSAGTGCTAGSAGSRLDRLPGRRISRRFRRRTSGGRGPRSVQAARPPAATAASRPLTLRAGGAGSGGARGGRQAGPEPRRPGRRRRPSRGRRSARSSGTSLRRWIHRSSVISRWKRGCIELRISDSPFARTSKARIRSSCENCAGSGLELLLLSFGGDLRIGQPRGIDRHDQQVAGEPAQLAQHRAQLVAAFDGALDDLEDRRRRLRAPPPRPSRSAGRGAPGRARWRRPPPRSSCRRRR